MQIVKHVLLGTLLATSALSVSCIKRSANKSAASSMTAKDEKPYKTVKIGREWGIEKDGENLVGLSTILSLLKASFCNADCVSTVATVVDEEGVTTAGEIEVFLRQAVGNAPDAALKPTFRKKEVMDELVRLLNEFESATKINSNEGEKYEGIPEDLLTKLQLSQGELDAALQRAPDVVKAARSDDPDAYSLYVSLAVLKLSKKCKIDSIVMSEEYRTRAVAPLIVWDPNITGISGGTVTVADLSGKESKFTFDGNHMQPMSVSDWLNGKGVHTGFLEQALKAGICTF